MAKKRRNREPVTLRVESISHEGRGVARDAHGKTVFVAGALPGETVIARCYRFHRRFDEARVEQVLEPAPERVAPRCPHAGVCGGCSLQHLDPAAQMAHKQSVLLEQLEHLGGVRPEAVLEPLTGPLWGYRHKARLGVKYVEKKGLALVGFREQGSPYITEMGGCEVLHESVGRRITALRELITSLDARARIPQIEAAVDDSQTVLVFRHLDPLSDADRRRLADFARETGLAICLQPQGPESIHPLWPEGGVTLSYTLPGSGIELQFLPSGFTQVNPAINRAMVERAVALLDPGPEDAVLELFCGLGNFSLPLARKAGRVHGVEGDEALVERARANAERNDLGNVTFEAANLMAGELAGEFMEPAFDKLLLDPPRSGAQEVLRQLDLERVRRIVYVSCNPATLARDAGLLVNERGYRLLRAGVMDMFPHTAHVESITLFER
ncbi:MAG: 23S rRNA (uracil(1939)-C(5))-methyltransferase RlmD [Gammaproteobacteria bacterium]|nr:MAG: 23S rRNA (uracil(1939)-C(5))-methyltransferase RlmD [Gammaproteobacteria bacterium]